MVSFLMEELMRLSAPKQISFLIAVILAILAVVANLIAIPTVSGFAFWILVIAFIVLAVANMVDGF